MNETGLTKQESIKLLYDDEATRTGRRFVSSKDALASRLPDNCTIVKMKVLEHPEPIVRR
jgi:hypothetical protein